MCDSDGHLNAPLPASAFKDGTILHNLANHNNAMISQVTEPMTTPIEYRFCTVCSGSEVFVLSMATLMKKYNDNGVKVKFIYTFGCEIKPLVQEWIITLLSHVAEGLEGIDLVIQPGCLFAKAEELGNATAFCKKHKAQCPVVGNDMCVAGTSCKDFSRASSSYKPGANIADMDNSVGGSAQTLNGFIAYLHNHLISNILFENVDSIDEDIENEDTGSKVANQAKSHLDKIIDKFNNAGFACQPFLTDAHVFGSSASRFRYYIIGLREFGSPFFNFTGTSITDVFSQIRVLVNMCTRTAPCASEVLLDGNHPAVIAELHRRKSTCRDGAGLGFNVSSAIAAYRQAGLTWGNVKLDPVHTDSPWFEPLSNGTKTALLYSVSTQPDRMVRDIGQSLSRIRYSSTIEDPNKPGCVKHRLSCQMPNQIPWITTSGHAPRVMIGRESMMAQGFPVALPGLENLIQNTSENTMASLGGNAMASPVVMALTQAVFASIPWNGTTTAYTDEAHGGVTHFEHATTLMMQITGNGAGESEGSDDEAPKCKVRRTMIR